METEYKYVVCKKMGGEEREEDWSLQWLVEEKKEPQKKIVVWIPEKKGFCGRL